MKKNDYLLVLATGVYSLLFYRQNAGINFLLFTIVLLIVLLLRNNMLWKDKKWMWTAFLCLISGISIFVHSSALSIIGNITALLLISAFSFNIRTSSLFSFFFSCYSIASSAVFMVIDSVNRAQSKSRDEDNKRSYKVLATGVVILLSILFFNMYKKSNPLFAENTKWINLDFISIQWLFFTLGGLLLVYPFFYHRVIPMFEAWENQLPLTNSEPLDGEQKKKRFETERYAGLLLFVMLNLMLVILNIGDIQTLYFNGGLPKGVTHSDFVHNGVGLTILSIIIATGLIMYLFRSEFSKVKNNSALMIAIYVWIVQNVIMLSSTALRNQIYIHDYNYTYKRVGVYIWLVLAALGLCTMYYKILKEKSNWYLVRTNVAIWFSVLILSGCLNWDKLITNYNIRNKPLADVDFYYLMSLSDCNIPELLAVTMHKDFKLVNSKLKNYTSNVYSDEHYVETYTHLLNQKIYHFLSDYKKDWRSFDLRDKEIAACLH